MAGNSMGFMEGSVGCMTMDTTIIPIDDAHEVLGTFGIGPYNKTYQGCDPGDARHHR